MWLCGVLSVITKKNWRGKKMNEGWRGRSKMRRESWNTMILASWKFFSPGCFAVSSNWSFFTRWVNFQLLIVYILQEWFCENVGWVLDWWDVVNLNAIFRWLCCIRWTMMSICFLCFVLPLFIDILTAAELPILNGTGLLISCGKRPERIVWSHSVFWSAC